MPRSPMSFRSRLPRRERVRTRELEEMFYLVEDLRHYMKEELEDRKKEEKEKEDKAKPKENIFTKKWTFGQMLLAVMVTGLLIKYATILSLL